MPPTPKPTTPEPAAKTTGAATTSPPANGAQGAAQVAEVEQLREKVKQQEQHMVRAAMAIRKLAAAILTPVDEGDNGQTRKTQIRVGLQDLVNIFVPE